jgi:hypothetical protein
MELGTPTLDVLLARIMWLGVAFQVLEGPQELRRHLSTVAKRLVRVRQARDHVRSPDFIATGDRSEYS